MASQTSSQGYGRVSLPGGNKDLEYILLWRDPAKSGAVLGAITFAYILLEWTKYSLLQILANVLLLAVSAAFLWSNLASFTGRPGLRLPRVLQSGVSESELKGVAVDLTAVINKILAYVRKLASGKDVILSIQVAAGLYGIAKFSSYFSTLGLAYTLVVLAFVLPKVYELRKDDIDRTFYTVSNNTQATYNQYVDPYVKKLPRATTATSSSAGNSTAEVQRKVEDSMNEATSNVRAGVNQGLDQAGHTYNKASAQASQGFDNLSQQAGQTYENVANQAQRTYNETAPQVNRAVNDTANQASRYADQASNQASHAYNQTADSAQRTFNQAGDSANRTYNQAGDTAQRTFDQGPPQGGQAYNPNMGAPLGSNRAANNPSYAPQGQGYGNY